MKKWEGNYRESIATLAVGDGLDFRFCYIERETEASYAVHGLQPGDFEGFDYEGAVAKVLEIAAQDLEFNEIDESGDEANAVKLIASGYDWQCVKCNLFNHLPAVPTPDSDVVTCVRCGGKFHADEILHAYPQREG